MTARSWIAGLLLVRIMGTANAQIRCGYQFTFHEVCEPGYENVLRNVSDVLSLASCSYQCPVDEQCRSFIFNPTTSRCMTSVRRVASFPGSCPTKVNYGEVTQVVCHGWQLSSSCSSDADCLTPNSFCFNEVCRCKLGYSHDQVIASCVSECDEYGDQFTEQGGKVIYMYNVESYQGMTFEQCKAACIAAPFVCRSIDVPLDLSTGQCALTNETMLTLPQAVTDAFDHKTFQRDCLIP